MLKLKILICLVGLISVSCKPEQTSPVSRPISELYLPEVPELFKEFETIDSTKQFQEFASKLFNENRDLNSSELYIYSGMFYARAEMADSVIVALNKAIDYGMSNPNILSKYSWQELIESSPEFPFVQKRLDSISKALNNVENFRLELGSMSTFWPYMERAHADTANAEAILKEYVFNGPPEVRDFYILRYESTSYMKHQMVDKAPKYYQYLQKQFSEDSIIAMKTEIETWMKGLKTIYPMAVFPKVYVVPGVLNSGGTTSEMGMYIGGDMYGRSDQMPTEGLNDWQKKVIMVTEDMSPLIMHELMHFEQNYQDDRMNQMVKGKVIQEGVCDFLAALLTGNPVSNENTRFLEDEDNWSMIVKDFKSTRDSKNLDLWMYNGGSVTDRPGDMGYTLGYLVSKSYYDNHSDKKQAVYNLLNTNNVDEIYLESDYAYLLD